MIVSLVSGGSAAVVASIGLCPMEVRMGGGGGYLRKRKEEIRWLTFVVCVFYSGG